MEFILRWHRFAVKHFTKINIALLAVSLFFLFDLRGLSFDGDWLSLFSKNDPKYKDYRQLAAKDDSASAVFVKLTDHSGYRAGDPREGIRSIEGVSSVDEIDLDNDSGGGRWLEVGIRSGPGFSADEQKNTIERIERSLRDSGIKYGLTGAIPILAEFTESIKADFIKTSLIALTLIVLIIIFFFGFSPRVIFGFIYQGMGLLAAMFVFNRIYGNVNSLAATLPCILLGLGIDFVIHSVVAVDSSGEDIYKKVSVPIFWGAVTTATAFLSLMFADLKGLHSAGVLGSLSVMSMFFFVILFLPAAVSRFGTGRAAKKLGAGISLPFLNNGKTAGAILLIVLCLFLSAFAGRVKFEDRSENLYNKDMATLKLQEELSGKLGIYPSKIFVSFESDNAGEDLNGLAKYEKVFVPDIKSVKFGSSEQLGRAKVTMRIFPRKNPFSPQNFEKLRAGLEEAFNTGSVEALRISGDSVLYHHLNSLLIKGMSIAFLAVFLFLAVVLLILFRNIRFAVSALAILFIATLATLGGFGLFSISLSAYTIILFPLFLGIGVDDCLHVAYLKKKGGRLVSGSSILKAITLTTVTTVLCYGSLISAKNAGFNSIGRAAVMGLGLIFLCAVYLLPVLLEAKFKKQVK